MASNCHKNRHETTNYIAPKFVYKDAEDRRRHSRNGINNAVNSIGFGRSHTELPDKENPVKSKDKNNFMSQQEENERQLFNQFASDLLSKSNEGENCNVICYTDQCNHPKAGRELPYVSNTHHLSRLVISTV